VATDEIVTERGAGRGQKGPGQESGPKGKNAPGTFESREKKKTEGKSKVRQHKNSNLGWHYLQVSRKMNDLSSAGEGRIGNQASGGSRKVGRESGERGEL